MSKPIDKQALQNAIAKALDRSLSPAAAPVPTMPSVPVMQSVLGVPPVEGISPLFDEAALLARSAGDRAFAAELIGVFCEAVREQLATIDSALTLGDVRAIRAQAHTLKGASLTVAANAIALAAAALEAANSEQLLPGADGRLVSTVHQTLQQWRMHGWVADEPSLSAASSQN